MTQNITTKVAILAMALAAAAAVATGAQEKTKKSRPRAASPGAAVSPAGFSKEAEARRAAELAALTAAESTEAEVAAISPEAVARAVAEASRQAERTVVDTQRAVREAMLDAERESVRARFESEQAIKSAIHASIRASEAGRAGAESAVVEAARATAEARAEIERAVVEATRAASEAREEASLEVEKAFERLQDQATEAREQEQESRAQALEKAQVESEKAREKAVAERDRQRERNEAQRERARERAEAERERAEAAREAAREHQESRAHRSGDLYEQAMGFIDEEDWSDALRPLARLIEQNNRVDASLYWSAYAQGKLNRSALALASLARLQKDFPASRWAREGKALEIEVRRKSGQTPRVDDITSADDDLKLMAVSALAQSEPEEALPLLARLVKTPTSSRRVRERALFVLAQIGNDQAGNAIAEVARGEGAPELQRKAIQYLGVFGGSGNRKVLSDIYAATNDTSLRKQILNSFMVSGDKTRVLSAARTETNPALRSDAVRLLGIMGGTAELSQMYTTATQTQEKKDILHALFLGGAVEPVATAARGEKDREVRLAAVRNLGLMGRKSQEVLSEMYRKESEQDIKKEVLNAFFLQGNGAKLVEIARAEKDPVLKKEAVHWLSLTDSKESRAFMLELLKD